MTTPKKSPKAEPVRDEYGNTKEALRKMTGYAETVRRQFAEAAKRRAKDAG